MSQSSAQRELLERELLSRPVASLQHMLRWLSRAYPSLPVLVVDGVFGERTLEAVMVFQRELGLPVTGVVNREVWDAIRDAWLTLAQRDGTTRPARIFPAEGNRVKEGDTREYMILPQVMFQVLSRYFQGIAADQADGVHGTASADNVRWLQRAAGVPETGTMDQEAWDALSRLYEIFVVKGADTGLDFKGGWG